MHVLYDWIFWLYDWASTLHPDTWTAIGTIVIALFTVVLAISTGVQARLTRRAIELGNKEFVASHRPRITVRGFEIASPNSQIDDDDPITVLFYAYNIGASDARITGIEGIIYIAHDRTTLPPPNLIMKYKAKVNIPIPAGHKEIFLISDGTSADEAQRTTIYSGDNALYCMGVIYYEDSAGLSREFGFCQRFHFRPTFRSERIVHPDYDYAY